MLHEIHGDGYRGHTGLGVPGLSPVPEPPRPAAPSVAALSLSPVPGEVAGNLLLAERAIEEAKRERPGLEWVVLPELFTSGYTGLPHISRHAEDAETGESVRRLSAVARELELYVAYGFPERLPGSSGVADSANLVGPEGLLLTYRKMRLVRETGEHRVFVPGVGPSTVVAGGVRVALAICWDLGFPEVVREAAEDGAELVLAPAGWRAPYGAQYELACAARALDNAVYLASANQLGEYPEASFGGPGGVFAPDGSRISEEHARGGPPSWRSFGHIDTGLPGRWRRDYGSTLGAGGEALQAL